MGNDIGFTEEDQLLMDLLKGIDEKEEKNQVYNKVLLIRKEETFLVNTIKNNLDKNGFLFVETAMSVRELNEKKDSAELMLMYVDDTIDEARDVLVFVKDLLLEEGKELVLLGDRNEVASVEKVIPKELIAGIFERPFDMRAIMDRVGDFLIQQRMQQNKKMILIVDDDPTYLKLIKEWLKDDYRVSMANSGMQAITWLANNCADLVLLDFTAPHLMPCHDVLSHLCYAASGSDVAMTMVRGRILYAAGKWPTIDLNAVVKELAEHAMPTVFLDDNEK